jgi:lysophospholipid acyltransferase (LPLAT)-like uncharacterized protein
MQLARAIVGVLLGLLARVWLMTLRVSLTVHPSLLAGEASERPWVLAFFHGKQWPLLAWKRRRTTAVMVSLSKDGAIQTRALEVLGFSVVRGSSSRGGARGLAAIVRRLRGGEDAAFAVDGPRGPYGVPKPGVLLAAQKADALIVPMGSAIKAGKVFEGAWDRFALAWPFARVAVTLGAPLDPSLERALGTDELGATIASENEAAEAILAGGQQNMVRFPRFLPRSRAAASDPGGPMHDL